MKAVSIHLSQIIVIINLIFVWTQSIMQSIYSMAL